MDEEYRFGLDVFSVSGCHQAAIDMLAWAAVFPIA